MHAVAPPLVTALARAHYLGSRLKTSSANIQSNPATIISPISHGSGPCVLIQEYYESDLTDSQNNYQQENLMKKAKGDYHQKYKDQQTKKEHPSRRRKIT